MKRLIVLLGFVVIVPLAYSQGASQTFMLAIDYSKTFDQMVAAGKYDWVSSYINAENFPIEGRGKAEVTIELVNFNRTMESDEVLRELDKKGLRPAILPELLAFGAKYPEEQRGIPIVALGSLWRTSDGDRGVPCLWAGGSGRSLGLRWFEYGWNTRCRFAAVRK